MLSACLDTQEHYGAHNMFGHFPLLGMNSDSSMMSICVGAGCIYHCSYMELLVISVTSTCT
jgi:hypothetical protein